jgi:glutathione peroxidase
MNIYDMKANAIDGRSISLSRYTGKVLIIVNTASKCGFTPQLRGLESLYKKYHSQGLEILGFPCNDFARQEPGTNAEVQDFCLRNYGVTFQMFEKVSARGPDCHPLFAWLIAQRKFQGFNLKRPTAVALDGLLREKHPEYLKGDSIKWNFTKFLISRDGTALERFEPYAEASELEASLVAALAR